MLKIRIQAVLTCGLIIGLMNGCSNNPISSNSNSGMGNVTLSIKGIGPGGLAKASGNGQDQVTLTSARVVIEKVELENQTDNSIDFKFNQPFVQDLLSITTLREIQTFQVPFGTYDKVKIDIDDLDVQDGDVFTQNPDLQNLSILVMGFLTNNPADTFQFQSDISLNIEMEVNPPLVIDEAALDRNIVLDLDYNSWFTDRRGNFIDPNLPENQAKIEEQIRKSFRAFKDDDRDGEEDDDSDDDNEKDDDDDEDLEIKAVIDSLGDNFLVLAETQIFVDDQTKIKGDDSQVLSFTDLAVGMLVEVYARLRDDSTLVAIEIEVEDDDDGDDGGFEAKAEIDSLGSDFLFVAETQIFVDEQTRVKGDDQELSFSDLTVGMLVKVRARLREDGTLVAIKIEVEDGD